MITDTNVNTMQTSASEPAGAKSVGNGVRAPTATVWRINVRLLVWSLVAMIIIAPCLYFWHGFQVRRHALAILERARVLKEKEDWTNAAAAFHQYLQIRPDDAEALLLRAETFEKLLKPSDYTLFRRAVSFQLAAVKANPERHDARRHLAELLLASLRFDEAEREARKVVTDVPDDVQAARVLADALRVQLGSDKTKSAANVIKEFQALLAQHPGDVQLSIGLAELLRSNAEALPKASRESAPTDANAIIDRMVAAHPDDSQALLARYRYRKAHEIADADADLRHAQEVAADNPEVLFVSAIAAADSDRVASKRYLDRLIAITPDERAVEVRRAHLTSARLSLRWNEPKEAIAVLKDGLSKLGEDDLEFNQLLLRALLNIGDDKEARLVLQKFNAAVSRVGAKLSPGVRRRLEEEGQVAQAQLNLMEGKPALALPILKRMAVSVTESADASETQADRERRWRLLALAYSQIGQSDLAASSFEELTRLAPGSGEYRRLAAAEWRANGDFDRAIRQFEAATTAEPKERSAWIAVVEARLDQQLRNPSAENRDWTGIDAALKRAQANLGEFPALLVLQAQVALARNDRESGLKLLRRVTEMGDLDPRMLLRLAPLLELAGQPEEADQAIEKYRKADVDAALANMTEVELLRRRGQSTSAIKKLEQLLEKAPPESRDSILRRLVSLEMDSGAIRSARRRLRDLRKARVSELWVYETAADLALMAKDPTELHSCEVELKSLEGANGTLWRYFEALRTLEAERSSKTPDVREANRLLGEIEVLRPIWPQTHLLRGRIAEQMGKLSQATEQYELAMRAGARNLTALQWLVTTLYKQNRYADAASYIRQFGQIGAIAGDLSSQAIPANLRANRIEDAYRVAQAAAELRPEDAAAQVWLGQTLALADKGKEAEIAFRKAVELAPADAQASSGLIWFLTREKRHEEARQALETFVTKLDTPRFERELALARGFEMIGDRGPAEKHYRDAISERPNDARLYQEIGRFYMPVDQEKALEAHLKSLEIDPKSDESRRAVALLWGLRGSDEDWQKAIALLENDKAPEKANDLRLEATLLLLRGGEKNALMAVELATELIKTEAKPTPVDRLLLAKANEDLGRLDEAQEQFTLIVKNNEEPTFLGPFVDFLIRHDRLDNADRWLSNLEEKEPDGARGVELRLKWLARGARGDQSETVVERFVTARLASAKTDEQKAGVLRYAADLLTRFDRFEAAEQKCREVATLSPMGYETYALWLAERGRIDEAVALCREKLPEVDLVRGANVLVRVLTIAASRAPSAVKDAAAIEELLATARQSEKVDVQMLLELGVLRIMEGRDSDAIALYEQALARDPKNVAVQNNLALALVEVPDRRGEALSLIDQAVATLPNSSELLDTRALVLIGVGRNREARELLEGLCRSSRKNPRYRLHLAIALHNLNDATESQRQAAQATEDGLAKELLTPSERSLLKRIAAEQTSSAPQ